MKAKTVLMTAALAVALSAAGASAAKIKNVFVVEATVESQCDDCKGMKKAELREITNELRRVAVNSLPKDRYNVMTKETVQAQGSEVQLECANANCVIQVGSAVGADYIVKGSINKFGKRFSLTVEMYETKDGNLAAALADPIRSEKLDDILDKISAACAAMYKKFLSEQNPPPTPTYQQQANQQPQPTPPAPAPQPQPPAPTPPPPSPAVNASTFTDKRDGKTYKTVVIGGKKWMAENLNYQPQSGKSWCYDNNNSNCDKYGRLYDWKTAKTVCPAGWHLPSRQDWQSLVNYAGGKSSDDKKLKARSGWKDNGNGTDDYGFSALPGGYHRYDDTFGSVGEAGYWWTAAREDDINAYIQTMHINNGSFGEINSRRDNAFSVRCIANW